MKQELLIYIDGRLKELGVEMNKWIDITARAVENGDDEKAQRCISQSSACCRAICEVDRFKSYIQVHCK